MTDKTKKRMLGMGLLVVVFFLTACFLVWRYQDAKKPWYEKYPVVTHALGQTEEGDVGTNSLEAFEYNYKRGQRVFEADIQITSDRQMVFRHDWEVDRGQGDAFGWTEGHKEIPTAETFLSAPILGKYTPLSLSEWFRIMEKYPDIYLVTDTKYSNDVPGDFSILVNTAEEAGCKDVLDRVIVQIYYQDMYEEVMSVYPFKNIIFTIYYIGYAGSEETAGFCEKNNIPVLTMPADYWSVSSIPEDMADYSIKCYVHTVDDEGQALELLQRGVDGIYSDNILNRTVRRWKK